MSYDADASSRGISMPVYLFTFHAYRSWMPDHRRGYVKRKKGVLPSSPSMAANYARLAKHERSLFDTKFCEFIEQAVIEICHEKGWRLHCVVVVWSHTHILISWKVFREAKRVRALLHHGITTRLRAWMKRRRPWLSRGGSVKRVRDRKHFDHHMTFYLPGHGKYGGRLWFEKNDSKGD
jgi:hypothetical protein